MSYGRSVGCKANKQWIWLAIDTSTREIVGVYVGKRSRKGAKGLWQSLPAVYRQCAVPCANELGGWFAKRCLPRKS